MKLIVSLNYFGTTNLAHGLFDLLQKRGGSCVVTSSNIVTRNDEVRGLTTAAGLWLAAGLGLALGVGFYSGALIGFTFSLFTLVNLKRVDIYIKQHARTMEVYLEYNATFSFRKFSEYTQAQRFDLFEMQRGRVKTLDKELGTLVFSIDLIKKLNHAEVLDGFYTLDGIEYLREII